MNVFRLQFKGAVVSIMLIFVSLFMFFHLLIFNLFVQKTFG